MAVSVDAISGAKFYISSVVAAAATDTTAEFAALTWVPVKGWASLGAYGDSKQIVPFELIEEDRVRKAVGAKDAGTAEFTFARDDSDAGQTALIAAALTDDAWAFKVEYDDKLTSGGANTIDYFKAIVVSFQTQGGSPGSINQRKLTLAVDSEIWSSAKS